MNAEEKRNPRGARKLEDECLEKVSGGTLPELIRKANERVNGRSSKNSSDDTGEAPKQ